MSVIRILDDHLISQIAAGEVVERPASVVKELVENSLDAGAQDVRVELEAGGKRRIVVQDDGRGMDGDDALLAFDRHATSKITSFDDLTQVATLGFRGEALASIAAVARVELLTATSPGDGHRVRIEGGRVKRAEPVAHPRGTRLEIASLFFNVPARRKFLKRPQTELRRSLEVVQGYALAHPRVRFTVVSEGRTVLETTPVDDDGAGLRERISQVFGRELADRLVEIPLEHITEEEAITGFVGLRDTSRGRRTFIYVNRRLIRDRVLLARFYRAVRDEWKSEDYPSLFLFLELEPESIDVNVHPQKSEVRFRDLSFVDRVEDALRSTLGAARGEEPAPLRMPETLPNVPAAWEGLGQSTPAYAPMSDDAQRPYGSPAVPPSMIRDPGALDGGGAIEPGASDPRTSGVGVPPSASQGRIARATFEPQTPVVVPLSGRSGEARPFRLLGQYKGTLILLEGPDGLYLIDQHVAHERLLYERLRREMLSEDSPSQSLLEPILLELSPAEVLRLEELATALEGCGFSITPLSGNTVAVRGLPTAVSLDQGESILRKLASEGGEGVSDAADLRRRLLEAMAASLACRGAVKMHHPLSTAEMQNLVSELFRAEQPYACPHGRPVVLQMKDAELERRFGRR